VGGTDGGAGNVISGNFQVGVRIQANGVVVQGNYIGTDVSGTRILGNVEGLVIDPSSQNVVIGGTAPGAGNLISANTREGVTDNGTGTLFQGNYIGTDVTGTLNLGNIAGGLFASGSGTTVGGTTPGAGNLISANGGAGLVLSGSDLVVQGNRIGTNAAGTAALPNVTGVGSSGLRITLGGTSPAAGNLISGNSFAGLAIGSAGHDDVGTVVQGNLIGTDVTGTAALGNGIGVSITGRGLTLGGTEAGAGNVISGNVGDGVLIADRTDTGATLLGNRIGTDVSGMFALPNGGNGVTATTANNVIGGAADGAGNLISGNKGAGLRLDAPHQVVQGNRIGTDVSGTQPLGNGTGVFADSSDNLLGGTEAGAGNLISGNAGDGITLSGAGTTRNLVQGNTIGADVSGTAPLGNGGNGVALTGGAHDNTVGGVAPRAGNVIAFNGNDGVLVDGGSGNTILHDLIFANANLGIELLDGGNNGQPVPTVTSAASGGGLTNIQVDFTGPPSTLYTLELFANGDPANPQGERFLISLTVSTNADGVASVTVSVGFEVPPGQVVTATLTDPLGNTSAFSLGLPVTG
jgi:hypothetical protein